MNNKLRISLEIINLTNFAQFVKIKDSKLYLFSYFSFHFNSNLGLEMSVTLYITIIKLLYNMILYHISVIYHGHSHIIMSHIKGYKRF